ALADLAAAFGPDRPGAVCRELTKTYEEVRRGALAELAGWAEREPPRGEITLVVAGAPVSAPERPADAQLRAAVAEHESAGTPRRDAIAAVAREYGLRRRDVYNLVVSAPE
ncbi:MAG TPA: 16S rRNA (cytidine(1402)-2'-O)-methyltransferase, partial [Rugosimonospora sp.]|nr:16S rRNA (cytidine(1402)-2'-O)-methyltransferase [Rugosimonospora sp.]